MSPPRPAGYSPERGSGVYTFLRATPDAKEFEKGAAFTAVAAAVGWKPTERSAKMSSMKIRRATSPDFANAVLNDVSVRPEVADLKAGTMDVSHLLPGPNHMILEAEHGIVILAQVIEGLWEFHPAILPIGRGKWAIDFGFAAQEFMFCRTNAIELLTRIANGHRAGEAIAVRCGFRPRWEMPDCVWHGKHQPYQVWSIVMQEWISEFEIKDVVAEMQRHGLERKATAWYNRWAALSREPLMQGGLN